MLEVNEMEKYTAAGTDIENVKEKNANSGMSYNEVKAYMAKTTGGHGTAKYSNTDAEQMRRDINQGNQKGQ
jgi:hypothetical protein